jgi:F1F0 ATPase subunit 2
VAEVAWRLAWPLAAGVGLGLFYFGLLWVTIDNLERSRWPGVLILVSFFGRLAVTMAGFFKVAAGRGDRLLACLIGFIIARLFLVSRIRPRARARGGDPAACN